jgi:hypothetical protein
MGDIPAVAPSRQSPSQSGGGRIARQEAPSLDQDRELADYQHAGKPGKYHSAMEFPDQIKRLGNSRDVRLRSGLLPLSIPNQRIIAPSAAPLSTYNTPILLRRMSTLGRTPTFRPEIKITAVDVVRHRKTGFFTFLCSELHKIETFYAQKEQQACKRLTSLRQQLHIMRDARSRETDAVELPVIKSRHARSSKTSKSLSKVTFSPITPIPSHILDGDDIQIHRNSDQVSYRKAKQRLRLAVQELHRSVELLEAYSLLNRTAFRKLNKKYDKAIGLSGKSANQYMNEHVNNAGFVTSKVTEELTEQIEDLYTRYFERGNRKLALAKLRKLSNAKGDKSESAFFNGALIGVGLTFAIEGVVMGLGKLSDEHEDIRQRTSYLLQIYAGYSLMLYLFAWFCLCCRIWKAFNINYPFVFEFDPKHNLDWRQLSEFPSFFTLLLGIFIWLTFRDIGSKQMIIYYPVLLIFITICTILLPLPILRWRSRRWFVYSHVRSAVFNRKGQALIVD